MPISADHKALLVARARIQRAAAWIAAEPMATELDRDDVLTPPSPDEMMACMDALVLHTTGSSPLGAFWRELERAAQSIRRSDLALEYHNRLVATITASETSEPEGSRREV